MKVAVLKLGARIAISSTGTSGGTGETLSIIKMLTTSGCEVDAYTKVIDKDITPSDFNVYNIEDTHDNITADNYDCLVVLNGNVNFFGGAEDRAQILNYVVINSFAGKVFYILCDPNLMLTQIWPSISSKSWASKYNKSDIEIVRDDIVYISQPRNVEKVHSIANKSVSIANVIHYPFEKFPLLTTEPMNFNENTEYDLLYGGTFRGGKREKDMIMFYFGLDNYNVTMFGNIKESNFKLNKQNLTPPKFEEPVSYNDFTDKMNKSIATVIIGDKLYKELNDLAQRIYESINAGSIVLIDSTYDYDKLVFSNPELRKFNYVYTRNDVMDRLDKLHDVEFRKHIYELQKSDINFNKIEYSNGFRKLLEDN